jgi:hypothetical protein
MIALQTARWLRLRGHRDLNIKREPRMDADKILFGSLFLLTKHIIKARADDLGLKILLFIFVHLRSSVVRILFYSFSNFFISLYETIFIYYTIIIYRPSGT